jgi:hypothetical protein
MAEIESNTVSANFSLVLTQPDYRLRRCGEKQAAENAPATSEALTDLLIGNEAR